MKRPVAQPTIAGGRTYAQIESIAKQAVTNRRGVDPDLVLQLLRSYARLYAETESLRQLELFTPPPAPASKGPITNG